MNASEREYLTAKRTVDDRALNRRVLNGFADALADTDGGVCILEAGAGTGTMLARLVEWNLLPDRVAYRGVDREPGHIRAARERVPERLSAAGYSVRATAEGFVARRDSRLLDVRFEVGDVFDLDTADLFEFEVADVVDVFDSEIVGASDSRTTVDAVIASAFLDLVTLPEAVVELQTYLDDGVLYAPITFDGLTGFVPAHPADDAVVRAYHQHMRERSQPGRPDAGRAVLESVAHTGGAVSAVGGSDWVIRSHNGVYPDEEKLVLEHLVSTVVDAVSSMSGETSRQTACPSEQTLSEWESERRAQLADGTLTFLAHNLDILARL